MADYDVNDLNYQQAIIIVASTFGDGEAPSNGKEFKKKLEEMRKQDSKIKYLNEPPLYVTVSIQIVSVV